MLVAGTDAQSQIVGDLGKDYPAWEKTYQLYRCSVDTGFWVWNKNRCIFESGDFEVAGKRPVRLHRFHFGQRTYQMREVSFYKNNAVYSGNGFKVIVRLKGIGICDYDVSNCTLAKYRAVVDVYRRGVLVDSLSGFAASGA